MKRVFALAFSMVLLIALWPSAPAAALEADPILRIGLAYGTDAKSAAKLINLAGQTEGYDIGYYDPATSDFYTLFSTGQRQLAVLKDKPMWVTDSDDYYDIKPSSHKYSIGCYHLEATASFAGYSEVSQAVAAVNGTGLKAFPAYVNGQYRLRVGEHLDSALAEAAMADAAAKTGYSFTVCGQSATCYTVTALGTDQILFEFDGGGASLGIRPLSQETWFGGYRYFGGFEYKRANGNDITVINVVGMTDYVKGIIPYEIGNNWPVEAMKAQALCAKCYATNSIGSHKSAGFDLCTTEHCQVYRGTGQANETTNAAVEAVRGVYITYEGKVAQTYYHASSGGYTEDVENIWGSYVPYLRAVEDKYLEDTRPFSSTLTLSDATEILQSKGYISKSVTDFYVSRYSTVGNALELTFVQSDGTVRQFKGDQVRTALYSSAKKISIGSHRFTIGGGGSTVAINGRTTSVSMQNTWAISGDGSVSQVSSAGSGSVQAMTARGLETVQLQKPVTGSTYVISGTGAGHNIGMSQMGAYAMANQGFTYDQIIRFYFTGVEVGHIQ